MSRSRLTLRDAHANTESMSDDEWRKIWLANSGDPRLVGDACDTSSASSRVCEYGTIACNVHHQAYAHHWHTFQDWRHDAERRDRQDPAKETSFWADTYKAIQKFFRG